MSMSRDGFARWARDRGDAIQRRGEKLGELTPDRMMLEIVAETRGNGIVTLRCGTYKLVYGIETLRGGHAATFLEDRSMLIPGVDPTEQVLMGAAVDAHKRAVAAQRR